jgi:hypothetical protein
VTDWNLLKVGKTQWIWMDGMDRGWSLWIYFPLLSHQSDPLPAETYTGLLKQTQSIAWPNIEEAFWVYPQFIFTFNKLAAIIYAILIYNY